MEKLIALAIGMIEVVTGVGELKERPKNIVGVVGSRVTLNCAGTNLKWDEFVSDDKGPESISSGSTNYAPEKYDVVTTPKERYDLTIKSLALTDGGKCRCKVIRGATAYAEVIVFTKRDPTHKSNTTTNKAVEGDYLKYSCEVKYNGTLTPVIKWTSGNSNTVIQAKDESVRNSITKFSILVEMTPSHNGQSFTCQTYFAQHDARTDHADNIPINNDAYKELYTFAQLTVYYFPRSLKAKVDSRSYSPGEEIKITAGYKLMITADSNPAPKTYKWMSAKSNDVIETRDSITVTADILRNQSLKVVVCNNIPIPTPHSACKDFAFNITGKSDSDSDSTGVVVGDVLGVMVCLAIAVICG